MIVLKHLAREFSMDPPKMRRMLREKFGKHRRWRWKNPDDPELQEIRRFLLLQHSKKETSKASKESSPVIHSPSFTTTRRHRSDGSTLH